MTKLSKREQLRTRQRRQKWKTLSVLGGITVLILGALGVLLFQAVRPQVGEVVPVPDDISHVEIGEPLTYPSNPPAGGRHYAQSLPAGFYDEDNLPNLPGDPEGYIVHSLEHGYVVFWYNCSLISEIACAELKADMKSVMDSRNNLKLIAFPWDSIDVPLVITSWGRLQQFEQFNSALALNFIDANRNKAPEPNAP